MDDEQPDYAISDPEELSQQKRIKELLNRRTGVIDTRTAAKEAWVSGELQKVDALRVYQTAIEGLIMDLWTKFKNTDIEDGEQLLHEEKIADVEVNPPPALLPSDKNDLAAGQDYPDPKKVPIRGLEWFINNDPVVEAPFTAYTWNPPGERTEMGRTLLDFGDLDKPVQRCIEFLDETGIDADMEEAEQQTKITRELLEEVDEWRQNNVN